MAQLDSPRNLPALLCKEARRPESGGCQPMTVPQQRILEGSKARPKAVKTGRDRKSTSSPASASGPSEMLLYKTSCSEFDILVCHFQRQGMQKAKGCQLWNDMKDSPSMSCEINAAVSRRHGCRCGASGAFQAASPAHGPGPAGREPWFREQGPRKKRRNRFFECRNVQKTQKVSAVPGLGLIRLLSNMSRAYSVLTST